MRMALVLFLTLAAACYASDAPDWHVSRNARASALFRRSAFVHGYMHGYERGFHAAGLDLNFARQRQNPEKMSECREAAGYKHEFGVRQFFEKGFREGCRVGYTDGVSERTFRALDQARAAAVGLDQDEARPKPSKTFDEGFAAGYRAGSGVGLRDAGRGVPLRDAAGPCDESGSARSDEYCGAYARGYRFGYSDAYVTRTATADEQPKKLEQLPASVLLQPGLQPQRQ